MTSPSEQPCPLCKGAGWRVRELTSDNAMSDRLVRCPCREGADKRRLYEQARALSDLDPDMADLTFGGFRRSAQPEAHDAASGFCGDTRGWLMLVGGPGTGKTHLLAAIANRLLTEQVTARWPLYCVTPRLLNRLRRMQHEQNADRQRRDGDYWERLLSADVLLLDDLGSEQETEWSTAQLYELLDHRYATRKPTVIATNLAPTAFPARLASRMQDRARSRVIVMRDGDYRTSRQRAGEAS